VFQEIYEYINKIIILFLPFALTPPVDGFAPSLAQL